MLNSRLYLLPPSTRWDNTTSLPVFPQLSGHHNHAPDNIVSSIFYSRNISLEPLSLAIFFQAMMSLIANVSLQFLVFAILSRNVVPNNNVIPNNFILEQCCLKKYFSSNKIGSNNDSGNVVSTSMLCLAILSPAMVSLAMLTFAMSFLALLSLAMLY